MWVNYLFLIGVSTMNRRLTFRYGAIVLRGDMDMAITQDMCDYTVDVFV